MIKMQGPWASSKPTLDRHHRRGINKTLLSPSFSQSALSCTVEQVKGRCRQQKSSSRRRWAARNQEQTIISIDSRHLLLLYHKQQQLLVNRLLIATLRRSMQRRSHSTLKTLLYRWLYRPRCSQPMMGSSRQVTLVTRTIIRSITKKTKMEMSEVVDEGQNSDVILNVAVIHNNLNKLYFNTVNNTISSESKINIFTQ